MNRESISMAGNENQSNPFLSKSLFIQGRQCLKSLWLHKYRPELKAELTKAQEALFQSGTDVGILAQQLFPGGIEIPYEGLSHAEQIEQTRAAIEGGIETIYEATFLHDSIFVKVDILHHGTRGWEIYEVKASTEVKDVHVFDAALQCHVLCGAGLDVARVAIVHVNSGYVRFGELDVNQLFTIEEITRQAEELQPFIREEIIRQRTMLQGDMPAFDIGPHCSDPYECDFTGHCWSHIPEDSVFDLRGRGVDKFGLYRQGIVRQADIPLDKLNAAQRFQVEATLGKKDSVDMKKVRDFLASLWYPLCFLDFETFTSAVPLFDGSRPYQQIPFQYSLHRLETADGEPEHFEYLASPAIDPREELLLKLLSEIPENACVLTYNQTFELGVLSGLAELFPVHKQRVGRLKAGVRDLMTPFRSRHLYLWQMKGSYSIKKVLPALVPELSYSGLEIADGGAAMDAWHVMSSLDDPSEVEKIRAALLEYCKLDTLAMVWILERMREITASTTA